MLNSWLGTLLIYEKLSDKAKGYILGAIAAATYGMNPLFALPLYGAGGMDVDSVLFFRYLMAIPIVGGMLLWRRRSAAVTVKEGSLLAVMGLLMAVSSLTLFESYNYMDSGVASTLLFVYPVMVALIMVAVFREKIPLSTVICIGLALCGIILLNQTVGGDGLSLTGVGLVMVSSLTYAVYIVAINRPALNRIPTLKVIFYGLLFGVLVFAARLVYKGDVLLPAEWYLWGCLLAVLPTAVSFVCTTAAIQKIGPTPTAVLGALEPVVALIFSVTVFGDMLTFRQIIGVLLILVAVTFIIAGGKITAPLLRFRRLFPRLHRKQKK